MILVAEDNTVLEKPLFGALCGFRAKRIIISQSEIDKTQECKTRQDRWKEYKDNFLPTKFIDSSNKIEIVLDKEYQKYLDKEF